MKNNTIEQEGKMEKNNKSTQSKKKDNWDLALDFFLPNTRIQCEECIHARPLKHLVIGYTWSFVWNYLIQKLKCPKN